MTQGLVIEDGRWVLTFGAYRAVVPVCACDRPPCTCRRRLTRDCWGAHHRRHCHSGHAEHIALLLRRARGRRRFT